MKIACATAIVRFGAITDAPAVVSSISTQNGPLTPPVSATTATSATKSNVPIVSRYGISLHWACAFIHGTPACMATESAPTASQA